MEQFAPVSEHRGPLDPIAGQVWERYPFAVCGGALVPLGNGGGFSGARLWRGQAAERNLCLRAWPDNKSTDWVRRLHRLMQHARRQGLDFVPEVYPTRDGGTVIEAAGRAWELTQWLDGRADFALSPSAARLEAACVALARLHCAWETFAAPVQPCPAVRHRLQALADWQALVSDGWRPQFASPLPFDPLRPAAELAWRGLPDWLREVERCLEPWLNFPSPVQPCLRDPWHDNLLFRGERLTGLIDYGAVQADHAATDLARLLGSLIGDDAHGWQLGLRAYRRLRDLHDQEEQLARVLDRTGVVLGLANWLRWLYHERRPYPDRAAIARRMETLLERIERMKDEG